MLTSITDVTRLTGTTSRTLRHYDAIGLLPPAAVDAAGRRWYDQRALVRLQRILLLRRLGMGLPRIAELLDHSVRDGDALRAHLAWLRVERSRIDRQLAAVERTIAAVDEGRDLMAEEMLDGFDHTQYRTEVEQRWGADAYARSDQWWRSLGEHGRDAFLAESRALGEAWAEACAAGLPIDGAQVRALAGRHVAWIATAWGGVIPDSEQIRGLAQMYVDDERFAANYGGTDGARYVRDALFATTA